MLWKKKTKVLKSWIKTTMIPDLGLIKLSRAIEKYGTPEHILDKKPQSLKDTSYSTTHLAR